MVLAAILTFSRNEVNSLHGINDAVEDLVPLWLDGSGHCRQLVWYLLSCDFVSNQAWDVIYTAINQKVRLNHC